MIFQGTTLRQLQATLTLVALLSAAPLSGLTVHADEATGAGTIIANTGTIDNSTVGNGSQTANGAGVALNNSTNDGNISNNQNNLSSRNANQNINYILPSNTVQSGGGGNSVIVSPRNPLNLNNATLGRSNLGFQFGVQNNPALSAITGGSSAMSWFAQGGVTIPFGKIPDVLKNQGASQMQRQRQQAQEAQRNVFGNNQNRPQNRYSPLDNGAKEVSGKVVGLSAYNLAPIQAPGLTDQALMQQLGASLLPSVAGAHVPQQGKVLALAPAEVFSQPLSMGAKIGLVEVGKEYPYLGHIQSGWVKVLLPTGETGWTQTQFEYLKNDYTELDTLTATLPSGKPQQATSNKLPTAAVMNASNNIHVLPAASLAPSIIKKAS
ncbi:MAG: hypothetical protein VKJ06_02705 [Vampirovibrionales bacterium]|nr:hypothetical protein [Vampirovibrionales bacterium]